MILRITLFLPLMLLACQVSTPDDATVTVLQPAGSQLSMTAQSAQPWYAQESALTKEERWVGQLGDKDGHGSAMAALTAQGASALPMLRSAALERQDPVVQGRSIVVMRQIGGTEAEIHLSHIQRTTSDPLVRSWAAAARIQNAQDMDTVMRFAREFGTLPGVDRPLKMAMEARMGSINTAQALQLYMTTPSLQGALQPIIAKAPADELVGVMLTSPDNNARRTAAGFIGGLAQNGGEKAVADALISKLSRPGHQVPWKGGALFVPGINWRGARGQKLITVLTGWMLFCEKQGMNAEKQQIVNNLQSVGLSRANGITPYGDGEHMLVEIKKRFGEQAAREARAFAGN
ncbi:MAG: hypothetical protein ACI9MC_003484 [Kiritimatiellia bacterium]|jgi:hypothetical protein